MHVPEADLPSNVALVRSLVNGIGRAVLDSVAQRMGDTVLLDMDSTASSWIVRTEFASLLGAGGRRVLTGAPDGGPAPTRWSVRGASLTVDYRDIRKPGIFSGPVANRVVSAGITSEVTAGGTIVFAGTMSRSVTDTVPEERIAGIETGSTGIATGKIPDLRSLDRYIEPFVIIGAAGVAILLFFQVRS